MAHSFNLNLKKIIANYLHQLNIPIICTIEKESIRQNLYFTIVNNSSKILFVRFINKKTKLIAFVLFTIINNFSFAQV